MAIAMPQGPLGYDVKLSQTNIRLNHPVELVKNKCSTDGLIVDRFSNNKIVKVYLV